MPAVNANGECQRQLRLYCMQAVNGGSASSHGMLPFRKAINRSGSGEIFRSLPGPSLFVRACWLPDAAPPRRSGQQQLSHSVPASNKPHLAAKSTPVWLAIWRTWAGFANSQHRDAAFATPDNICAHSSLLPHWAAAQTDANLSAHLPRLPTPPPYLRQMRLLHGRGAGVGCRMMLLPGKDAGVGWQMMLFPAKGAGVGWQMMLLVVRGAGVGWQVLLLVVRDAVPANHRAHESLF